MLRRAQARAARENLLHVAGLCVMDATRLAFPTGHFDSVVAPYVLTVVPDPAATLDELARVVKPGGEIVLVNHVGGRDRADRLDRVLAWQEIGHARLAPGISLVGPRRLDRRPRGVRLVERRRIAPLGPFTLARIERIS